MKNFHAKRLLRLNDHHYLKVQFIDRQRILFFNGILFICLFLFVQHIFWAGIALLFLHTSIREIKRMKKCGIYWQTKRTIETVGF